MPHSRQAGSSHHCQHKQRGAALMVMLVIMIVGSAAFLVSSLSRSGLQIERDRKTSAALAQAKEALIGYAVNFNISTGRPGDLPCPDTNNDGSADSPCSGNAIGRLPWKTLGLPDLRDGSGERLWYAVSAKFKNSPRTTCTNSNLTGCLNSDTPGTITVFTSDGTLLNDGGGNTGAVAVIIAPGDVLQRQGATSPQNRSCTAGVNCDTMEKCTTTPPTLTPKCDPTNYLDIATVGGSPKDNASFIDGSSSIGFIQGRIKDNSDNVILNDQLLVITQDNIMQPLQKRVAAEVKNCLTEYAALPQNQGPPPNQGYYPWATARTPGSPVTYNDSDRLLFGHIPDMPFAATCSDTGGSPCGLTGGGMQDVWGANCNIQYGSWWPNWKEMVFYGLANRLRPHNLTHTHACSDSPNPCLVVNPPSTTIDKHFVVIVAGEKLPRQVRTTDTDKSNLNNYLEGGNATGASPFEQRPPSATFNDTVVFQ